MGFADLLIKLNIPYNSEEAILFTEKLLSFFSQKANDESVSLAAERGVFPNYQEAFIQRPMSLNIEMQPGQQSHQRVQSVS